MATFQITILVIAVILLILALTFIGISLKNIGSGTDATWPPMVSVCPDYFTLDSSGKTQKCINSLPYGKDSPTCQFFDVSNSDFQGDDGNCKKKNWAINCGVSWDGITYGVPDPCDISSSLTT